MDRKLLDLYERELAYVRDMGVEFAREFPKVAGRLGGLDDVHACPDPFVERLLEGFAFLSARVQLKLEAEFPRFTESLLGTVYPDYLAPTPSMCMVQFEPALDEPGLAGGFTIPRTSRLLGTLGETEQTRCEYRTAHEVVLWPLQIVAANYCVREMVSLDLGDVRDAKACLRLRLQTGGRVPLREIKLDSLVLYLEGPGDIPTRIYEQVFAHAAGVIVQPTTRPIPWRHVLGAACLRPVGFQRDQSLLPYECRLFDGYRLLREYFAFRQRFLFLEVADLRPSLQRSSDDLLDIVIPLRQADPKLENVVGVDNFRLFCTPAINLFPKRLDRVDVTSHREELHVVADKTKSQDFEIYRVTNVVGYGEASGPLQEFLPFYSARDFQRGAGQAYFLAHRDPMRPVPRERLRGERSRSYAGNEVYLSLVDAAAAPYGGEIKQLGVEALCTNRHLPLRMPTGLGTADFTMDQASPCRSIRCVGTPTPPQSSHVEGDVAWRAISHLSLNYLSLTDDQEGKGASALRDILRLYCPPGGEGFQQVEGLRSIACRPIVRRLAFPHAVSFARGVEVTVTLEEALFTGLGVFVLGAVLERFFAKYVSVNSFAETVVRTVERGEIIRWARRPGQRPQL
ncbi:MAG: type VI secretion system baseplate subunit TssF [Planctomycetes bacterium]|nr:type VI secretion system baseplate subunit TssF [Planctomycetota bacterium]